MKIRNGFVSNSSSSSFLVLFEKNKKYTKEKLQKIIFGDQKVFSLYEDPDYTVNTKEMVEQIYNDYKKNFYKKNTIDDIFGEISFVVYLINSSEGYNVIGNGNICSNIEYANLKLEKFAKNFSLTVKQYEKLKKSIFDFAKEEKKIKLLQNYYSSKEYFAFDKKIKKFSEKIYQMIKNNNKDFKLKYFHYSDNDGTEPCCLEHGNVFKNFKHYRFSHH